MGRLRLLGPFQLKRSKNRDARCQDKLSALLQLRAERARRCSGGYYGAAYLVFPRLVWCATNNESHSKMRTIACRRCPRMRPVFGDRGVLSEGAVADVVVYDLNGLGTEPEWVGEIVHGLPGGEWRRVQRPKGLPLDYRQWGGNLQGGQLHRDDAGQAPAQRPRLIHISYVDLTGEGDSSSRPLQLLIKESASGK